MKSKKLKPNEIEYTYTQIKVYSYCNDNKPKNEYNIIT